MSREARDIMGEALRLELLGATMPQWKSMDDEMREQWRRRADHIERVRSHLANGVEVRRAPPSSTIQSNEVVGKPLARRVVRKHGKQWQIVLIDGETEEVEDTFFLSTVYGEVGLILSGDPAAARVAGLGKRLAAAFEILRLHAFLDEAGDA